MGNTNRLLDNELELRYEQYKNTLKELTIMSDIFMRNVFKNRECVEYVLRIIMEMNDLHVVEQTIQKDYKNLQGRSAILDCVARDDIPGAGLPIYHADRMIKETGKLFGDGSHIIYVSSGIQDNSTELGKLMHDLHCKNAKEMYSSVLAQRVSELKETEEGIDNMCKELEWIYKEGEVSGEIKERKKTVKLLLQKGMSVEEIAQIYGEKEDILKEWLAEEA